MTEAVSRTVFFILDAEQGAGLASGRLDSVPVWILEGKGSEELERRLTALGASVTTLHWWRDTRISEVFARGVIGIVEHHGEVSVRGGFDDLVIVGHSASDEEKCFLLGWGFQSVVPSGCGCLAIGLKEEIGS